LTGTKLDVAGDRDRVVKFPDMDRHIADLPKLRGAIMLPGRYHISQRSGRQC
jgi:hypothetical protein